MKANELRIGNYINTLEWIRIVDAITQSLVDCGSFFVISEEISGIELTEEWLINLGFEKKRYQKWFHKDFDKLYCKIANPLIKHFGNRNGILVETHFVHELQNIFYFITKQELILKTQA